MTKQTSIPDILIKKVARALAKQDYIDDVYSHEETVTQFIRMSWKGFVPQAKAAIEAIDKHMVKVGNDNAERLHKYFNSGSSHL